MKLPRLAGRMVEIGVLIASGAVVAMMLIGAGDAILTFLGHPIPGALELAELLMVLVVFLSLPEAEAKGKHIRIDLVTKRLPTMLERPTALLSAVLGLVFYGAMAWQAWRLFADSWAVREFTAGLIKFPVFPTKALFAIGLTAVVLIAAWNFINAIGRYKNRPK